MTDIQDPIIAALGRSRLLPTVEPMDTDWPPILAASQKAGITAIEVLLRDAKAMRLLRNLSADSPIAIGAGTVCTPDQCREAIDNGAQFIVCPGLSPEIVQIAQRAGLPVLPGVATPTEVMQAMALGLDHCKFFPAEAMGGTQRLKAFDGPFPGIKFLPTGGVNLANAADYLGLTNVLAVGGGFILPEKLLASGEELALSAHLEQLSELVATS